MKRFGSLLQATLMLVPWLLLAHDGHNESIPVPLEDQWIRWIGNFHPVIMHFPISFIIMTGVSEFLYSRLLNPLFDHASRFMILAAAFTAIPNVILGAALGYVAGYSGWEADYYGWHRLFGVATTLLVIAATYTREYVGRDRLYFTLLGLSILGVTLTGYFGGSLTFGPDTLVPPFKG